MSRAIKAYLLNLKTSTHRLRRETRWPSVQSRKLMRHWSDVNPDKRSYPNVERDSA